MEVIAEVQYLGDPVPQYLLLADREGVKGLYNPKGNINFILRPYGVKGELPLITEEESELEHILSKSIVEFKDGRVEVGNNVVR